jgi:diguanylate cyclase (GGDEF)-like protein
MASVQQAPVDPVPAAADGWLNRYRQLAERQPAGCASVTIPAAPQDMRTGAFVFAALAGTRRAQPGIVYSQDSIVERLIVLAQRADGCISAAETGRALPLWTRTVTSPLANIRIPAALGDVPPVAVVADPKSVRPWVRYAPEADFRRTTALRWALLGGYAGVLAVLLLVGLGFAVWRRNIFALSYVVYLSALQFYQLQALGLGPMWVPLWPGPEHARLMQAIAVALVVPGIAGVVLAFLRAGRGVTLGIAAGVGLASVAFLSSAWTTWGYRLGAMVLAVLAVVVLTLLVRRLRTDDMALRWFAAGLGASMVGGGLQSASVVFDGAGLPEVFSVAFPIGNLVESVCWLVALAVRFRAEHVADRRQLWFAAYHDSITGLYNRHWLCEEIAAALAAAARQPREQRQLLLLDLDDFAKVNARCGHSSGDAVLHEVGAALQRVLEPGEVLGRFGGDEFLLLLRADQDPCAAEGRAGSILTKLAEPIHCGAHELRLRGTIGIASLHAGYARVDDVIADAGLAQDIARRRGGNVAVRFDASMRRRPQECERLRRELAAALRADQLLLHYQPVVSLDTGRPLGFEALLRWQHPTRGLLPAAQFIPIAIAGGLIHELGYHVIRLACEQLRDWQRHGTWYDDGQYLSINLSTVQLGDERLLEEIRHRLDEHGVDPCALRLELPEAALTDDRPDLSAWRERLLGQQLLLCLDDFGSGSMPLAPLADLAFDSIKLDRSMAPGVMHQGRAQSLVRAAVAAGEQFSCLVVAKGIESREQQEAFKRLGCGYGQGDYLAPPMSADALIAWIRLWQAERPADTMSLSDSRLH